MGHAPDRPAGFLKTHQLLAALITLAIVALSVTGFVWAQKGVTVVVDGESRFMKTQVDTVGALLEQADIAVSEGDVVSPAPETQLADGDTVVVRHAIPVTLQLAGNRIELSVVGSTVADALIAAGIDPGVGLDVEPALSSPLEPGMSIVARDVFVRIVEETVEIPFGVVTQNDAGSASGTREITTTGVVGKKLRVFEVIVVDGVEGERKLLSEQVVVEPVDEVVSVGTKRTSNTVARSRPAPAPAPAPTSGEQRTVATTAYAPGVDGVGTRTATGARAGRGIIAVDPSVIPLGTRLYIPGYGYGVAADTGGAIRGAKIDLCFDTRAEAIAWGRRTVTITLLP
jgi:uncharacterized protein YabE (DUF348 family)